MRILLVEDDPDIIEHLSDYLESEGFAVENARGQKSAADLLRLKPFDLVLLDISLEDGNGFALCSEIKDGYDIPVIFLTASGDEYSTVAGFELGADDYVAKPFRPRELLSRIKNVLRRRGHNQPVRLGSLSVDTAKGLVSKNGREIFLSAMEYRLLLVFLSHKGQVISRERLIDEIWSEAGEYVSDNTLSVYIKRLRDKIEDDPQNPALIKTVRGLGYRVD